MKTKDLFKTIVFAAAVLFGSMTAEAANKNNLIYNSEEKDGVMVAQTVYRMEGQTLANYMKYNYKYDDQKRMIESETLKWDASKQDWKNDICIRYEYKGKSITTTYHKWNNKQKQYVLAPEQTVTMDNPNL